MKKSELVKAAKEINQEVLDEKSQIETKGTETEYLIEKLKTAAQLVDKDVDDLSDETWAVLEKVQEVPDSSKEPKGNGNGKDLTTMLAETKKLADLKALCEDNDEFKSLRKKLDQFKGLNGPRELRPLMEKCLGIEPAAKSTEKKPAKGKKKEPTDHSKSNKAIVYLAWNDGEKSADKLHKKVKEAVKLSTIKVWVAQWENGKNLPAIAKQ